MATKITKAQVYELLSKVMDPELHIDIVSLGLIYKVGIRKADSDSHQIHIEMTLTTPGCPLAPVIDRMIKEILAPLNAEVTLELIWDPPWTMELMAEEAKLKLGML